MSYLQISGSNERVLRQRLPDIFIGAMTEFFLVGLISLYGEVAEDSPKLL